MKKINFNLKKNIQKAKSWFLGNFIPHRLWRDWIAMTILGLAMVLNILVWWFLKKGIKPTPELIPVSYTIFGINKLGRWYEVFILPAIGLFVLLLNLILCFIIYKREKFVVYLLLGSALLIQIFVLISSLCLIVFLS